MWVMKWIVITLLFIFIAWKATVFFVTRSNTKESLVVTDTLLAKAPPPDSTKDSVKVGTNKLDTIAKSNVSLPKGQIDTKGAQPQQVVDYAKTLIGTPYLYGST